MNRILTAAGFAAFVAALSPALSAQWPAYPAANMPKAADGKPNLTAPAPRLANGKPDLSGMWTNVRAAGGQRGQAAAAPAPPADGPPVATFRDAGAGFKEGLPFTP